MILERLTREDNVEEKEEHSSEKEDMDEEENTETDIDQDKKELKDKLQRTQSIK